MSKTYSELKTKIEMDMDTEDEAFVQDTELMELFNDAIRDAEGEIHNLDLDEHYYQTYDRPAIVLGTAEYAPPSDIYGNKYLKGIYNDGSRVHEIREIKGRNRFAEIAMNLNVPSANPVYRYYLRNIRTSDTAISTKWGLTPTPQETTSQFFQRWYIRQANRMTADTSVCDLPDACLNFLYAYVAWRIWGKEGDGRGDAAKAELENQRRLMIQNLDDMTPDGEDEVERDLSVYDEHS